ncbi:MAG TPA: SDR family oxidoreductase [Pseudorhodoplanes sp.]|nr:SDR family oxidoreductase [Pseudorhodoplanes sp.]
MWHEACYAADRVMSCRGSLMERNRALVLGATGVVGRNLLQHLMTLGDWDVIAASRRRPDIEGAYRHLPVDLLDKRQTRAVLGDKLDLTHVFYSAYVERPTHAEMVAPNMAMLENVVEAVEATSPRLQHINLMHGTKFYGNHLGPFPTPAREDDARHMPPNFYHSQQDWVVERQKGKTWTWSSARPHAVCGFATGNPMNLVMVIAVYAAISKALGLPLRFPGTDASYRALYQCTDSGLLAKGLLWMAQDPKCANQPFNIINGDLIRWERTWPRFADYFGMKLGDRQHINLVQMMKDKGPLWDHMVAEYGLQPVPYEQIVLWNYGDYVFSTGYDVISSTMKARTYGFTEFCDTEEMFIRYFDELQANRIIPKF